MVAYNDCVLNFRFLIDYPIDDYLHLPDKDWRHLEDEKEEKEDDDDDISFNYIIK